jgi:hypothetical protein
MNTWYAKGAEKVLRDGLGASTLKFVLVDLGQYTPNFTTHQYLSDVPAGARITTTAQLAGVSYTVGVLKATNPTLPDVGGGVTGEALVLINDTGNPATSDLIALFDTAAGLPITEDSTADSIQFAAEGILSILAGA